jgi:hypothetical protein
MSVVMVEKSHRSAKLAGSQTPLTHLATIDRWACEAPLMHLRRPHRPLDVCSLGQYLENVAMAHAYSPKNVPYVSHLVVLLSQLLELAVLLTFLLCRVRQELAMVAVVSNSFLVDHDALLALWCL